MLRRIKKFILSEIWYWRAEAMLRKLCMVADLEAFVEKRFPRYYQKVFDYYCKVGDKLENADRRFWYYSELY